MSDKFMCERCGKFTEKTVDGECSECQVEITDDTKFFITPKGVIWHVLNKYVTDKRAMKITEEICLALQEQGIKQMENKNLTPGILLMTNGFSFIELIGDENE